MGECGGAVDIFLQLGRVVQKCIYVLASEYFLADTQCFAVSEIKHLFIISICRPLFRFLPQNIIKRLAASGLCALINIDHYFWNKWLGIVV